MEIISSSNDILEVASSDDDDSLVLFLDGLDRGLDAHFSSVPYGKDVPPQTSLASSEERPYSAVYQVVNSGSLGLQYLIAWSLYIAGMRQPTIPAP